MSQVIVQVPPRYSSGMQLPISIPNGTVLYVLIPDGMSPGQSFVVTLPPIHQGRAALQTQLPVEHQTRTTSLPQPPKPPPPPITVASTAATSMDHSEDNELNLPKPALIDRLLNSCPVLAIFGWISLVTPFLAISVANQMHHEPFVACLAETSFGGFGIAPGINTFTPSAVTAQFDSWMEHKHAGDEWMFATRMGIASMRVCSSYTIDLKKPKEVESFKKDQQVYQNDNIPMGDMPTSKEDAWIHSVSKEQGGGTSSLLYTDVKDYDGTWNGNDPLLLNGKVNPNYYQGMKQCTRNEIRDSAAIMCTSLYVGMNDDNYGSRPYYCPRNITELIPVGGGSVRDSWLWTHAVKKTIIDESGKNVCEPVNKDDKAALCVESFNQARQPYIFKAKGPNAGIQNHQDLLWNKNATHTYRYDVGWQTRNNSHYKKECAFTFGRFQFPGQLPCNTSTALKQTDDGQLTQVLVLSVATGRGGAIAFILRSGFLAKCFSILVSYILAARWQSLFCICGVEKKIHSDETDPRKNLALRTRLNTPCAICMVYTCCFNNPKNIAQVKKNLHDAQYGQFDLLLIYLYSFDCYR